jgi:hypothetical protein
MAIFSTDPILQVAFWTGAGALLMTCLIGLQTIQLRTALQARQRRERAFVAVWRPALAAYVLDRDAPLPAALDPRDRIYFLKLWNHLQESLRGDASDALNACAHALGCDAAARRMLARGNRAERLLAALTLGHLRDAQAWDALALLAASGDSVVSVSALSALIRIDAARAAQDYTTPLLEREDWPLARVTGMLLEHQQDFAPRLVQGLADGTYAMRARALRIVEALHFPVPDDIMARLFAPPPPGNLLIAALRLTPTPALLAQARKLAAHGDWRVRVQVAKVLGLAGDRADTLQLRTLLADREWWVRYRAAHALAGMPSLAPGEFAALRDKLADRYARDMVVHVLAEKGQA